ncbi:hypothetical protein DEU56DRAFT_804426 [Suillus clintonianus]|uniref:uncharacterized protein n=1 Tax=Suillus clintonianus TaxID=1904413 RepID=UPI001B886905|nr:uncharacterized protein DEU56DRAFT_804426 [Suillus clintonianus]KAG2137551.1 hypothetical protein DEU56DRAFT_804426 [Suillus clintonianus]
MSVPDTFGLQLAKYTNVAASAILIYDYFVTLHSEVQWTWGRKWGIIRTAFTVSRYVPFAGALMTSYSAVKTWGTQDCAPFNDAVNGIHFLGIIASEVLLIVRIYVFSGSKKAYLIILLSFGLVILAACVILSAAPINLDIPGVALPCVFEGAHSSALVYGLLSFFEIVLMSIMAFLRYQHYLGSHSTLMKSIYRDGLLYMFCITMISTVNVIVIVVLPLSYSETLNVPQIVAHSVLASRILFNLQASGDQSAFPAYRLTTSTVIRSLPQAWYEGTGRETVTGAVQPDQA